MGKAETALKAFVCQPSPPDDLSAHAPWALVVWSLTVQNVLKRRQRSLLVVAANRSFTFLGVLPLLALTLASRYMTRWWGEE